MFREALDYPTRPPRGGRAVLIGGTLLVPVGALAGLVAYDPTFAPVLLLALVPWLLVRGYYVRVLRTTVGAEFPTPPPFGDVTSLLRDGVAAALVAAGYLVPGTVVLAPFVSARARGTDLVDLLLGDGASSALVGGLNAVAGVVALFAVFSLIAAAYALPVAVTRYAYTGSLRAAFDLRTVASGAATEDYVVAWGVTLLLQALVLPVAYLLRVVLVGFYVQFLVAVGVRYCYGQSVGAALDLDAVEGRPRPGSDALQSAVRPLEESSVPELQEAERGRERERNSTSDGAEPSPEDDPFEYPARDRSEGERT